MAGNIAKTMANFAGDVWQGMSKGVDAGKSFRVSGGKKANQALQSMKKNNPKLVKNTASNYKKTRVTSGVKARANVRQVNNSTFGQKAGNFVGGGIRDTYNNMSKKDMKFKDAIKAAHTVNGKVDGMLSKTKMAGIFVGASAAGRIATGGGVMKDKNGNTNVIGIPFI